MSQGEACKCAESKKPVNERAWDVTTRRANYSAFNGYHRTPSNYSAVRCKVCRASWRTNAKFVDRLPDAPDNWWVTG